MRTCVCALAFGLLLACDEDRTVEIRICSDAVIPGAGIEHVVVDGEIVELAPDAAVVAGADYSLVPEIDTVRVVGRDREFEELNGGAREINSGNNAPLEGFALTIDFPLRDSTRFIEVEGLLNSVKVASYTRAVDNLDSLHALDMPLTDKCYGTTCSAGQTCVRGSCKLAPTATAGGQNCEGIGP